MSFYYLCMPIWGGDWNQTMNNGLQYYPRAITPTPWYVLYHQPPFPNHQDALLTVHKVFSAQKTVCFKKVRYRYLTKDVLIENTIHCEYKPHWAGCPGKEARQCPETWAALYTRRNIPQCDQKLMSKAKSQTWFSHGSVAELEPPWTGLLEREPNLMGYQNSGAGAGNRQKKAWLSNTATNAVSKMAEWYGQNTVTTVIFSHIIIPTGIL